MPTSTRIPLRLPLVILALIGVLLACTLSLGEDDGASDTNAPDRSTPHVDPSGVPTVWITSPVSGQQVPANRPVDITVATDSTTTSFLLNVDGRVASTKALPPDQSGPAQAILTWQPNREGMYNLEVVAFNGDRASTPVALSLQVSGTAAGSSPGDTGTVCTGRVLVSQLNFRDGPGTGATKLGKFSTGETVTIIGRNADTSWYKVQRFNTQQVWVINNANWLQVEGQCGLPVME